MGLSEAALFPQASLLMFVSVSNINAEGAA
jgi:hypothetical protein